jgi:hypothetical protein
MYNGAAGDTIEVRLFVRGKNLAAGDATVILHVRQTGSGRTEKAVLQIPAGSYPYTELQLSHVVGSKNAALVAYDQVVVKVKMAGQIDSRLFVDDVSVLVYAP